MIELQNEGADEVSQGQVFAGENYKRRHEVEGGEMVQDAGNRLPRLSDLTSNEFISVSIDFTDEKLKIG